MADLPAQKRESDTGAWHLAVLLRRGWTARIVGEGERFTIPREQTLPIWQDGDVVQVKGVDLPMPYALLLTSPLGERVLFPMNDGEFARDLLRRAQATRVRATDVIPAP